VAIALAVSAASASVALAATEVEPNDDVAHANGPMEPDAVYEGSFQAAGDHDRFMLYVNPQREAEIAVSNVGEITCGSKTFTARLLNADGRRMAGDLAPQVGDVQAKRFKLPAAAGPSRYYVVLDDDCAGGRYQLIAGPAGAVTTASPAGDGRAVADPAGMPEPNDDIARAAALQAGVTYGGGTDAPGDEDWYVLYTNPQQLLDVAVTKVGPGCSSTIDSRLYDADGDPLKGTATASDETDHLTFATPALPARYYIQLFDTCAGDAYQLRVGPNGAIAAGSPLMATAPGPEAVSLREGDDTLPGASGPLKGATRYAGDFSSPTDVDHAYFYSSGEVPLDISIAKLGHGCSSSIAARLVDPSDSLLEAGGPANNRIVHFDFTARRATLYALKLSSGCAGDPYQLRIEPPTSVSATPPPAFAVAPRRDRKPPYRFTVKGNLVSRLGLARSAACRGGTAVVTVKARRKRVVRQNATLLSDCSYEAKVVVRGKLVRRARKLRVGIRVKNRPELKRFAPAPKTVRLR
jgi:hypothetical protein